MSGVSDVTLAELWDALEDGKDSPSVLARLMFEVRELRALLAEVNDLAGERLATLMESKTLEVPGIGVFERRTSRRRTQWRHDELVPAVVARIVDDPSTLFDLDTGEKHPPAEIGMRIANGLKACISFGSGKVTGLRALGIQADEFCAEDPAAVSIQLPPRKDPS